MSRAKETVRERRGLLLVPALGLVLVGLVSGQARALDWFYDNEQNDMQYEIVTISHDCDCDCPRSSRCPSDCEPSAPTVADTDETTPDTDADIMDEPLSESFQEYGGAQLAMRGSGTLPGYIDDAFIRSRVRVRYDNMQGANEPTRAEMWYPTLGNFGGPGPIWPDEDSDPAGSTDDVDFQELSTYVEAAFGPRFSVFGEFPIRWVSDVAFADSTDSANFQDGTQAGAGDIRAGVRYGLIAAPAEALTLQVRAWAPTGEARRALGVGHSSIDVALLYNVRASQRTSFFAEIQDWQTIDAGDAEFNDGSETAEIDLDANVLRYGTGIGYDIYQTCGYRPSSLTALFEVVGWTVLEGATTQPFFDGSSDADDVFEDASGDTIVNGKYGVRYNWNCGCYRESVYVGYGHNWTDERWYSDVFRLELTHFF